MWSQATHSSRGRLALFPAGLERPSPLSRGRSQVLGQEAGLHAGGTAVDAVTGHTINSWFPKSANCGVELPSGSPGFLRPSGVSLVF